MKVTVGHLYPDYLNIYADRGNIAVLTERARLRGHELAVVPIGIGDAVPGGIDLFYVGGGQDREQALVSHDLAGKGDALRAAVDAGAAFLAVCGGYQLLGRFYRDRSGEELPGIGLLPLHTVAGERRMIGDVLLDCGWAGETLAGFEGCRQGRVYGTYLHGPLLPRNPWFADRLLADALGVELEPLDDALEAQAHAVSAERARSRGGRF